MYILSSSSSSSSSSCVVAQRMVTPSMCLFHQTSPQKKPKKPKSKSKKQKKQSKKGKAKKAKSKKSKKQKKKKQKNKKQKAKSKPSFFPSLSFLALLSPSSLCEENPQFRHSAERDPSFLLCSRHDLLFSSQS